MKRLLTFIAIGSFFATVEEFLTIVVIRHDFTSYLFTVLILFPVFLTIVWFTCPLIGKITHRIATQEIIHFFIYGVVGLMIEWSIIGLSPWSDPNANPVLMILFQLGMFSFWATVAFVPRLFMNESELSRKIRRGMLKFYIPYFIIVYGISSLLSNQMKFTIIILLIIIGYLSLNLFYFGYFRKSFERNDIVKE